MHLDGSSILQRRPLGIEGELDCAAEFVGNKLSDRASAVARLTRNGDGGAAGLDPFQQQPLLRSRRQSQRTVMRPCGVDSAPYFEALVTSSCNTIAIGLGGFRGQQYIWAFYARTCLPPRRAPIRCEPIRRGSHLPSGCG